MPLKLRSFSPPTEAAKPASTADAMQALSLGQYAKAAQFGRDQTRRNPKDALAWLIVGIAEHQLGRLDAAAQAFQSATTADPNNADAWNNLGNAQRLQNHFGLSVESLQRAVQLNPLLGDAHLNLARSLIAEERFGEALQHTGKARELMPAHHEVLSVFGQLAWIEGRPSESVAAFHQVLERQPDDADAWSGLLMSLNYCDAATGQDLRRVAEGWAATIPHAVTHRVDDPWNGERPIRLGYVSPDFGLHPVGFRMRSLLAAHDPNRVEITLYNNRITPDAITQQIRDLGHRWVDIAGVPDSEVAERIAADQIDVLVDLSGHTGSHRLGVFALKPAPLQLTWFGYFGTTGLTEIDGFVADPLLLPESETDQYTERGMPLSGGVFPYQPSTDLPAVTPPPCLKNGFVTFGSFNTLAKVGPTTIALWVAVLKAMPDSKFRFSRLRLDDPVTQSYFAQQFTEHGIDPSRLQFCGQHGPAEFFASHAEVDILLDSLPFNGSTTVLEGLLMGVPVVSHRGDRMVGHLSEQVLVRIGHPEWVTDSEATYVNAAVALASDREGLSQLRTQLRQRVLSSPLCDVEGCARAFEDLIERELTHLNSKTV